MPIVPTLSITRRTSGSNLPSAEQLLKNRLIINRINREQKQQTQQSQNTPEVHYEPKEGVYYQFNEEPHPVRRMMGFREWCEKVYHRRENLVDAAPPAAK